MDVNYWQEGRSPKLVRKIMTQEGKKLGRGVIYQNDEPAREIREGELYTARINGRSENVIAGPSQRQLMYLVENRETHRVQ